MARVIYGNAPEGRYDIAMVQFSSKECLYYGYVLHDYYTWSHRMVFAFSGTGPWYIANDWRVCAKCGRVVERFNSWRDHGHGEKYGSVCLEKKSETSIL